MLGTKLKGVERLTFSPDGEIAMLDGKVAVFAVLDSSDDGLTLWALTRWGEDGERFAFTPYVQMLTTHPECAQYGVVLDDPELREALNLPPACGRPGCCSIHNGS